MARAADRYVVDFPTLFIVPAWIRRHCIVADSFLKGTPFRMYDWQLWCTLNHYRVKPDAAAYDDTGYPTRGAAFFYRRSQVVGPQKTGKGPWSATIVCAEAVGPVLFAGWAQDDDVYHCADHGCDCGWTYKYRPGEPMGMQWPTPLIQLLATSEDQVDNVYRHLRGMARNRRLSGQMKVREGFIRVGEDGIVEVVTSSAQSRLGNPTIFCLQDESQLYTEQNKMRKVAETMRRGAAGMGGRSMETTNPWDPSDASVAQRTAESQAQDIFKFYEPPPPHLSFTNKAERRRIFAYNYAGSPHASVDMMLAEAAELIETDPGQAERFYGNRIVQGQGAWILDDLWQKAYADAVAS